MARLERAISKGAEFASIKLNAALVSGTVAILWFLEGIDFLLGGRLDQWGIVPRTADGLYGIAAAPFLHGGFGHLISNTVPFAVLSVLILLRSRRDWLVVSAVSGGLGGFLVWLTAASNSVHIGASSIIFGYLGYLLSRGIFERKLSSIVIALLVFAGYGGVLYGVLPGQPGISWQGHLFGLLSGVLAAKWLASRDRAASRRAASQGRPTRLADSVSHKLPEAEVEAEALEADLAELRERARYRSR